MADLLNRLKTALAERYAIERELGAGGMATVYLAEDLKHHRKVAVKVLHPELAATIGGDRFLREIEIAAQLNHPHILPLYDSGAADGFLYYVMPVVEGSLRSRIAHERQLPIEDALAITRQVAAALDYAHRNDLIHRDIKPENILVHEGEAMVADFGIARVAMTGAGRRLTATGVVIGTPQYMSPEQASAEAQLDGRSDTYSLACVLYEMLTGEPPHSGATAQSIMAKRMTDPPLSVRRLRETIPVAVDRALTKALAKVPADRFGTVAEFAEALSGGAALTLPWAAVAGGRNRVMAGAAVGLLLAAGVYWLLRINQSGAGQSPPALIRASVSQLTSEPGVEWFPSLSPDGMWLAYSAEAAGNRDIYLKSVGGQNPINLTADSPDDDDQPAFSTDGERIAFTSSRDGGGIFVMGRTGEAVRRVTRTGFKPTWSPDGKYLAYVSENVEAHPQNYQGLSQLWVVPVDGGEPRQIEVFDAVLPSWSPGGHRIAYTGRLGSVAAVNVWTVPAGGGEPVAATNHGATDWNPVWSPEGRYLYFASDRGGSMNLWRVPINEESGEPLGDPEPITTPATALAHITVSADGQRIAYSSTQATSNIQRAAFDPSTRTFVGQPSWVTTGSRRWSSPDVSPDGTRLAFYSLVQPNGALFLAGTDGTSLRQVTSGDSVIDRVPRWSPDGEWIAFFSNRSGPLELWMIRPDGSELTQLTDANNMGLPVWSPEGDRMAVLAAVGDGGDVFVFDPRRPWERQDPEMLPRPPASLGAFGAISWSPDGERLAGQPSFSDAGIIVYTFGTNTYERLTDVGEWPMWLPDSRHLLFVTGGNEFLVVDTQSKEVQSVFKVTGDVLGPPRLSPNGREVYFTRRVDEADVWLLTLP